MALQKNQDILLKIEDMTNEGSAVGHYDGQAVFVRGAVTGDSVNAHIIKAKKSYAVAIVNDIVEKSPYRIDSDCKSSAKCGGCSFRNMTYEAELMYKQNRVQDVMKRIGNIDTPVDDIIGADKIDHYRNKAQYPVYIENGQLNVGFYAYKSHRIIPCDDCRLQDEAFLSCIDALKKWVSQANITSYNELTGKGLLRHIYLRRGVETGEIMACAVINGKALPCEDLLVKYLTENENVKSICLNINQKDTNVILGDETRIIYGSETITDILLGKRFVIAPEAFYQINHAQCERLYSKAIEYADLTGEETVVDLYCGAGTIGISMSDNANKIYGVEIVPEAIENAKLNAKLNNVDNAEFFCGDAFEAAKDLENRGITPDVLVLDPPRKGCQPELFDVVERMNPKRIVYVSCDPATLARDLSILKDKGYQTKKITPVDLFPRTVHVESVVLLTKVHK